MKRYFLLSLLLFSTPIFAQKIVQVRGTKTSLSYVKIQKIQNTDMWTEVVLEFTPTSNIDATLHKPTGQSPFVLKDRQANDHVLVYQKGWDGPNSGGYGSISMTAGQKKVISLFFNKIDNLNDVYSLNESNCEGDGCWFFNDLRLVDESDGEPFTEASAKINRAWIDDNVTEDGQKGIRIHANFNVYNLVSKKCQLTLRFQHDDDTDEFLETINSQYQNNDGEIAVSKNLSPAYLNTIYADISLFVPHSVFGLATGTHDLKFDVDLNDENGTMIQHLNIYKFKYKNN